jgi:hypothetical protein
MGRAQKRKTTTLMTNSTDARSAFHKIIFIGMPDINVCDQMGMVDVVSALKSDPCDVAILHQQRTSLQQPEIVGNTNIIDENQERVGDDSVNNATRQARENPDTGR